MSTVFVNGGNGGMCRRSRRHTCYCHFDHYHYDHYHCYCHIVIFLNLINIGTKVSDHVSSFVFAIRHLRGKFVTPLWQVYSISQHVFSYLNLASAQLSLPSFSPWSATLAHLVRAHQFWPIYTQDFPGILVTTLLRVQTWKCHCLAQIDLWLSAGLSLRVCIFQATLSQLPPTRLLCSSSSSNNSSSSILLLRNFYIIYLDTIWETNNSGF